MLAVVTIVAIATFRMQPVYVATVALRLTARNANILPFPGTDSYDYMMDLENYIETQSKVLTSETLALQTIRKQRPFGPPGICFAQRPVEAVASGSPRKPETSSRAREFLGSLSVRRVPNSRLMDVSFESTDPQLARASSTPTSPPTSSRISAASTKRLPRLPRGLPTTW